VIRCRNNISSSGLNIFDYCILYKKKENRPPHDDDWDDQLLGLWTYILIRCRDDQKEGESQGSLSFIDKVHLVLC
jgi:hypothetical protein